MKLTFLGTGAADWNAAEHGHLEGFRRNSSLLIDGCLLIDPGPDVPEALETFGKNPAAIRYLLNTHPHSDHYCAATVDALPNATLYRAAEGETLTVGPYTVTALPASHGTCRPTVHFLITDGTHRLFYGLDGAWLTYGEVEALWRTPVDYAVLDATVGFVAGDYRIFEHNNLNMVIEISRSMRKHMGRICISHMARTLHTDHATLAVAMAPHGIEVAFDGYEIEL